MASFLRDEHIRNVWIDESALLQIAAALATAGATMPLALDQQGQRPAPFLSFIVRFDNKGNRVFSTDDLIANFQQARYIERVVFNLESPESLRTNRAIGGYADVSFDHRDENRCVLAVSSDDRQWVDATFSAVQEILSRHKTRHGFFRGNWTQLAIQVLGVGLGFLLGVWAATRIAPSLAIENAFLVSFLLALLIFSNLWAYLSRFTVGAVASAFPNIDFRRPTRGRFLWLWQTIIGGVVLAVVLYMFQLGIAYIGKILGSALVPVT